MLRVPILWNKNSKISIFKIPNSNPEASGGIWDFLLSHENSSLVCHFDKVEISETDRTGNR